MKTFLRIASVVLLLFNGIGACYGGWLLMTDPTGGTLQLPLHWLEHSPFADYFIPGIVLFCANGLLSFVIAFFVITGRWRYPLLVMLQGAVLTGWIVIQVLLLQMVYFLHFIMGGTGLLLLLCGLLLQRQRQRS